jgi:predicted nucleic-acid-binding protein
MIAIDTNVLVRLFINDDVLQAQKARALFDNYADIDESLWIADIVLIELVWALDRSYARPRDEICTVLRALAGNATVCLESGTCLREAIALYAQGPAGFADCMLAVKASHAGCNALHSFDKEMRGLPGVKLL